MSISPEVGQPPYFGELCPAALAGSIQTAGQRPCPAGSLARNSISPYAWLNNVGVLIRPDVYVCPPPLPVAIARIVSPPAPLASVEAKTLFELVPVAGWV